MSFISKILGEREGNPSGKEQTETSRDASVLHQAFEQVTELLKKEFSKEHGRDKLEMAQNAHFLFRPLSNKGVIKGNPKDNNLHFETDNLLLASVTLDYFKKHEALFPDYKIAHKQGHRGPYATIDTTVEPENIRKKFEEEFPMAAKIRQEQKREQQAGKDR